MLTNIEAEVQQTKRTKPNWKEARTFCELIAGENNPIMCFQVFDDTKKNPWLAECRHGRLSDRPVQRWLVRKSLKGCGVYICVSQTDGNGRRAQNVTHARAAWADFDGTPVPKKWPIEPDLITETSKGKFQAFFLLEPESDLGKASRTQLQLAAFFGSDPSIHDPPRVCRVPGFDHLKGEPFRSRIVTSIDPQDARIDDPLSLRHYLDSIIKAHPCELAAPTQQRKTAPRVGVALRPRQHKAPEGGWDKPNDVERARQHLRTAPASVEGQNGDDNAYAIACALNDMGISPELSFTLMKEEWNDRCLPPWSDAELKRKIHNATKYKQNDSGVDGVALLEDDFDSVDSLLDSSRQSTEIGSILSRGLKLNCWGIAVDTFTNALVAIHNMGLKPCWDELQQNVLFRAEHLPWPEQYGRVLNDHLLRQTRMALAQQFQGVGYEPRAQHTFDALAGLAYQHKFNPVLEYLASLKWDGTPRVENLFPIYFNCGNDAYTRAVSVAFMVGAVRRMRRPGSKFDTMPVMKGAQGVGKSSGVKALFGADWFSDADLGNLKDKDSALKLRGIWCHEWAEIEGMNRAETGQLKAFLSRATDRQRDPYARVVEDQPRRCVFIGTCNEGGYLKDSTGGRRFWPLDVTGPIDLDRISADRDQLWAEAAAMEAQGVSDVLPAELWPEAGKRQAEQASSDPWADVFRDFLDQRVDDWQDHALALAPDDIPPLPPDRVHTSELFAALNVGPDHQTKDKAQRIRTVMEATLGWRHRANLRIGNLNRPGYMRQAPEV